MKVDNYELADSDTNNLYKAIKRLRLKGHFYDRVGYLAFRYLFQKDLLLLSKSKISSLYEQFLIKHKLENYITLELILNLTYNILEKPSS